MRGVPLLSCSGATGALHLRTQRHLGLAPLCLKQQRVEVLGVDGLVEDGKDDDDQEGHRRHQKDQRDLVRVGEAKRRADCPNVSARTCEWQIKA